MTSSDSGQAARFGGGSPIGDDYFAVPVVAGEAEVELPAIEDACARHDGLLGVTEEVQVAAARDYGQAGQVSARHSTVKRACEEWGKPREHSVKNGSSCK